MKKTIAHLEGFLKDFGHVLVPPVTVLGLHILRMFLWPHATNVDMLAHFAGGAAVAWSAAIFYRALRERRGGAPMTLPLFAFFLVGMTTIVGVLWEFQEYLVFHTLVPYPANYDAWTDTISDLALDMAGALVWAAVEAFRRKT